MCRKSKSIRVRYKIHAVHLSTATVTFSVVASCGIWEGLILMLLPLSMMQEERWSSLNGEDLAAVHRAMEWVEQLTAENVELRPLHRRRHLFDGTWHNQAEPRSGTERYRRGSARQIPRCFSNETVSRKRCSWVSESKRSALEYRAGEWSSMFHSWSNSSRRRQLWPSKR